MGIVVQATHRTRGGAFALKILRPELATNARCVKRFAREARAASAIESEHVAKIFDVGTLDDGRPFFVMELLEGVDLERLLKARGRMAVSDAVRYVRHACAALGEAHHRGLVHRDIKPSNLFLAITSAGDRVLKVLDFGISKNADASVITQGSAILGTPRYMSPEQMRGARYADARSDVWSLGAVLYELLVGAAPFEGNNLPEVCASILIGPAPDASARRPDVPLALSAIIRRCLTRDPVARFPSAEAFSHALDRVEMDAGVTRVDTCVDTVTSQPDDRVRGSREDLRRSETEHDP